MLRISHAILYFIEKGKRIMKAVTEKLFSYLMKNGCQGCIVSVEHLSDLQEDIDKFYHQRLFNEEFYNEHLTSFKFKPLDVFSEARSLIIVAVPQPQLRVTFTINSRSLPLIIPPTYLHYPNKQVAHYLQEILEPEGYQIVSTTLPIKLLAVHSGLGSYGKNNICYVPGMGSFHRLVAFYSDLPCYLDNWQELQIMESCQKCSACLVNCPTQAITSERFLLFAERCITYHNERANDFPDWIEPSWHNCLVGCLHCQSVCPQNKDFLHWIEDKATFSQEETALLLNKTPIDQLPEITAKKLKQLDLIEYLEVLPRNISVFIK